MKVLLVKPHNLSDHIQPSLGLGYLASSVRARHDVSIVDCIKEGIKTLDFPDVLTRIKPDVVGIQCYTYDLRSVKYMLRECKRRNAVTVLGGPHPSAVPEETMKHFTNHLDYLFQGEAEIGLSLLLDKLSGGDINFAEIPGLVWRGKEGIVQNEKAFPDIDNLELPSWDLIKPHEYPEAQHGAFFKKFPIAPIITTRGCPFSCTFCAGNLISGKRLRKRSVPNVLREIKLLYNDFGIREFHIIDDNFTLDRDFAKSLLIGIKNLGLDISLAVPNGIRVDTLDDELLGLMKKTGLYLISLGIESGSDRILKLMKKNITAEKIKEAVSLIKKHKIDIAGFFILGFPGEGVEDIKKTIKFSLELGLIRANFFTYLPFPGTESFVNLREDKRPNRINLKRFYFMNASFVPEGMNKDMLKRLQREAFFRFFLRPKILFKNLKEIKSVRHLKFLLRRFFRWVVMP